MSKCATCKNWKPVTPVSGWCESLKICESAGEDGSTDQLIYSYDEGGGFRTGKDFGCVHWQPDPAGERQP